MNAILIETREVQLIWTKKHEYLTFQLRIHKPYVSNNVLSE